MSFPPTVKVTRAVSLVTASICGAFAPSGATSTFAVVAPEQVASTRVSSSLAATRLG
jgi:hypothetical protein